MGFVYDKVATFLASDLRDLPSLLGETTVRVVESSRPAPAAPVAKALEPDGYLHDIFVSHDGSMSEWVLDFVEPLKQELTALRGGPVKIFVDLQEIRVGDAWLAETSQALLRSKVLLAILTPRYLRSELARREFLTFRARAQETNGLVLLPVYLREPLEMPAEFREYQWIDLRKYSILKTSPIRRPAGWQREIMRIAETLNTALERVPPFNRQWQLAPDLSPAPHASVPIPRL